MHPISSFPLENLNTSDKFKTKQSKKPFFIFPFECLFFSILVSVQKGKEGKEEKPSFKKYSPRGT